MAVPRSASELSSARSSGGGAGLAYHSRTYWEKRFEIDPRETHGFEWLSPSTTLLTCIPTSLLLRQPPVRILHIGVGTSSLSLDLLQWWHDHSPNDWKERAQQLVNVDFSKKSIEFQQNAERNFLQKTKERSGKDVDVLMEYHVLNLLDWEQMQTVLGHDQKFDIVLDKSTTDSISTGNDTQFDHINSLGEAVWHPRMKALARSSFQHVKGVAATQVLGIHLGAVVNKRGIWLCHSYSQDRWQDVLIPTSDEEPGKQGEDVWPWTQVAKSPVSVASSDPNAPQINHYIYTMQRS